MTPLINGKSYDWASIKLDMLGMTVMGVKSISYSVKQEKVNNYGAGSEPVSRGRGRKEYEASITLEMTEVRRIKDALNNGESILEIPPFNIVIQYNVDNVVKTDTLEFCEFLEDSVSSSEGDTTIDQEMPLIVGKITSA